MTSVTEYTFDLLNTPFARDHAMSCLSKRTDDFVEQGNLVGMDALYVARVSMLQDPNFSFILVYENGQLIDQVGVVRILRGDTVHVNYGLSAPVKGSMSYVYGDIFSELLKFLSSEGYVRFTTTYTKGHSAEKLYLYYLKAFPQYNFTFEEYSTLENKLTIDLVGLEDNP